MVAAAMSTGPFRIPNIPIYINIETRNTDVAAKMTSQGMRKRGLSFLKAAIRRKSVETVKALAMTLVKTIPII